MLTIQESQFLVTLPFALCRKSVFLALKDFHVVCGPPVGDRCADVTCLELFSEHPLSWAILLLPYVSPSPNPTSGRLLLKTLVILLCFLYSHLA
jgi:hypothetical protein